jgi:hypothetical protein
MKPVVGIVVASGVVLVGVLAAITLHRADTPVAGGEPAAPLPAESNPAQMIAEDPAMSAFAGWEQWTSTRQTAAIAAIMGDPRLSGGVIAFLQRELGNQKLEPGTRNNIANALIGQDVKPTGLAARFTHMIDDTTEALLWRDYAVQRLVATLPPEGDVTPVATKLIALIRSGPATLPGTALIQLDLLIRSGRYTPGPIYADALAYVATAPDALLENRMTAITKIGEQGSAAQLTVVRKMLTPQTEAALLRVSIATLGLVGTRQDRPVVAQYLKHANQGVVLAAEAAIKRLDARAL